MKEEYIAEKWATVYRDKRVDSLSIFFEVITQLISSGEDNYWYRGHAGLNWKLIPSALRQSSKDKIEKALNLRHDFSRLVSNKMIKPPAIEDHLSWLGVAQHYGIPTRFLDWTSNPAIALYFTVASTSDEDGAFYILNPLNLNLISKSENRIFDSSRDKEMILEYLELDGKQKPRAGKHKTIAIQPVYNSERIVMQRGAFTLHGDRQFALDSKQSASLVCIPIKKEDKKKLKLELRQIGIDQMSIFPEPEHVAKHLKNIEGLI